MDEKMIKQVEHALDMCEALRDYLLDSKICESIEEVIDFVFCAIQNEVDDE